MTCGTQYNPSAPGHRPHAKVVWNSNSRFNRKGRNPVGAVHGHDLDEDLDKTKQAPEEDGAV